MNSFELFLAEYVLLAGPRNAARAGPMQKLSAETLSVRKVGGTPRYGLTVSALPNRLGLRGSAHKSLDPTLLRAVRDMT